MNVKILIEDVIINLANNCPIESISSKVQVISRLLKNDKFRHWVDGEFVYGYKSNKELPEYRILYIAGVRASYIAPGFGGVIRYTNQQIPIENLGEDIYMKIAKIYVLDTLPIIQNAIKPNKDIYLAVEPYESGYIQEVIGDCQIQSMHKVVSKYHYQRIIDYTKAKLIDFFQELNETVLDNEIDFNVMAKKREIDKVVNNTIYAGVVNTGEGNIEICDGTVIGGKDNQVTISPDIKRQLNEIVNQIDTLTKKVDCNNTDITNAIVMLKGELKANNANQKPLRLAFHAIKGAVAGLADTGIEKLVNQAINLLL